MEIDVQQKKQGATKMILNDKNVCIGGGRIIFNGR